MRCTATRANPARYFQISNAKVLIRVNLLNTCHILHFFGQCGGPSAGDGPEKYSTMSALILRAVLLVHATRSYQYSACVPNCRLLTLQDVVACSLSNAVPAMGLARRPMSEGKFTDQICFQCMMHFACGYSTGFQRAGQGAREINALQGYNFVVQGVASRLPAELEGLGWMATKGNC